MLYECKIEFCDGKILTKEMLQQMYNDPYYYFIYRFQNIDTAIITGMSISCNENNTAEIGKGIMLIDGKVYIHDATYVINANELESGQKYIVCLEKELDEQKQQQIYKFKLKKEKGQEPKLIFARFRFNGSKVFHLPERLEDLQNLNTNLDIFDMPYCNLQGIYACHPIISKCLLQSLRIKKTKTIQEYCIINEILNTGTVSIAMLCDYMNESKIYKKIKLEKEDIVKILSTIKNNKEIAVTTNSEEVIPAKKNKIVL